MTSEFNRWTLANADGEGLIEFTSFISSDISASSRAVSSPIEEGSFSTYNKVQAPLEGTVVLGCQGEPDQLQGVIDTLNGLKEATTTFSLITPEQEFRNLTLESFSYSRKREDGVNVIYVELRLLEIRSIATQYVKLPARKCKRKDCASPTQNGKTNTSALNVLKKKVSG